MSDLFLLHLLGLFGAPSRRHVRPVAKIDPAPSKETQKALIAAAEAKRARKRARNLKIAQKNASEV